MAQCHLSRGPNDKEEPSCERAGGQAYGAASEKAPRPEHRWLVQKQQEGGPSAQ